MITDDALGQLIRDRALERERDSEAERLAVRARERPSRVDEGRAVSSLLALLVPRRQALQ
jgi:hypothetical protein